jgi:large subunit ribosomal protein L3
VVRRKKEKKMVNAIIGRKLGMTQIFDEKGLCIPVTVIEAGKCPIVQIKTVENDGYSAAVLGFDEILEKRAEKLLNKPELGVFKKASVKPQRILKEVEILDNAAKVGDIINADIFAKGQKVDIFGKSKGHGFTGAIKRHNFSRGRMSHGGGPVHRHAGSMGANSTPSRVMPGKKMPGHYGQENTAVQNLEVISVDIAKGVLLVKGGIPGAKGSVVVIKKAVKVKK